MRLVRIALLLSCVLTAIACAPPSPVGTWSTSGFFVQHQLRLAADGKYRWVLASDTGPFIEEGRWRQRADGCVALTSADPETYAAATPPKPSDGTITYDMLTIYGPIYGSNAVLFCPDGEGKLVLIVYEEGQGRRTSKVLSRSTSALP